MAERRGMGERKGPVVIELEEGRAPASPAEAPPVPEPAGSVGATDAAAMQRLARVAARRPARLARWFWGVLGATLALILSLTAWDFVTGLLARNPLLGWAAAGLVGLLLLLALGMALRELAGVARLARLDSLRRAADAALASAALEEARAVVGRLERLYRGREDLAWARARLDERKGELLDADALLELAEAELLAPLDAAARAEVEAAARQVATVTAIVPLALADVAAALVANLRMIRRVAEIYGGRGGALGSWRLARSVLAHLVATGAVAVGDDMLGSIAGGGVVSKLSRRFGEGIVNGALTARVGVAAMEVCRPLPFRASPRPSVTSLVRRALSGLFGQG
ncbi:putative membrane protein [Meinhardsimonia xiamenensis]|jgi:putative membrane protein|uniref:Putative membrane protein n=1 Tax=Meinhardsimonia xiamenensis TaxID=990712 RepID=A0A1G9B9P0_9RHOB|nr:TIGR01620 family protein [Meinhardsimonia xiamenensis]PRX35078.1 putative membrane protein [Meinhardsimonia xiamenensis]SDK35814.1 putative membrane protein [Meinhardsimonia xiamenensis]